MWKPSAASQEFLFDKSAKMNRAKLLHKQFSSLDYTFLTTMVGAIFGKMELRNRTF